MNGTRGLTARADGLLSVGRVQTPTLALVVAREDAIDAFVPEPYWEVQATLTAAAGRWTARYIGPADAPPEAAPRDDAPPGPDGQRPEDRRGRLPSADAAAALVAKLRGADARVTLAERDRQTVPPPLLHHLTSLQREANRRHRFTAARTLRAAQALYEQHKLITYPRTDSRHLTHDVAAGLPAVVAALTTGPWAQDARRILQGPPPAIGKRIVDDSQVTDHHAIIPTALTPDLAKLGADERAIYELIARRLLAALSPPALYARTRLVTEAAGALLEARGRVRLEAGWEAVEPPQRTETKAESKDKTPDDPELPPVEAGDAARVEDSRALAKQTRPPPRYTEASLLGAMERAGRDLDDAALRAAMRDSGLGTPATRAAIVETLVRRGYLDRDGRLMQPTPAGRALVAALPEDTLKSPRLTAEWERRLGLIAAGEADPSVFRRDIRRFVTELVAAL
ncbi:MAG: DNA topoisomerase, partial [bacterium]